MAGLVACAMKCSTGYAMNSPAAQTGTTRDRHSATPSRIIPAMWPITKTPIRLP
jgi:hypothetical protein